jgi:hypothetical protein
MVKKPVIVAAAVNIKGIGCGGWWEARLGTSDGESEERGVKSAFSCLSAMLQSYELSGLAASLWPLAPSSANMPNSPMTLSLVPPLYRSPRACLTRPKLESLFGGRLSKARRDGRIARAVHRYGNSQREVAEFLGLHYATVSRLANRA